MSGSGSINDPWDLATALASNDYATSSANSRTIWLRGGRYSGDWTTTLAGVEGRPLVIRSYPGEWAIIDGNMYMPNTAQYVTLMDLELCWTGWTDRESEQSGSVPTDITLKSINGRCPYMRLINCFLHDLSGPYIGAEATGSLVYGCVSQYNGWKGSDRAHGHGIYAQNSEDSTVWKYFKDNIVHDNADLGFQFYRSANKWITYLHIEGNTSYRNGSLYTIDSDLLIGSEGGISRNNVMKDNMTYGGKFGLEFYSLGPEFTIFDGNYCPNGHDQPYIMKDGYSEGVNYFDSAIGNRVFVRPNEYQSDRANVTIYNQSQANSVVVDLSSVPGLSAGNMVRARNTQDYRVDVQTLQLNGDKQVTIDMRVVNRSVQTPVLIAAPATTFPDFGCFVVEKA